MLMLVLREQFTCKLVKPTAFVSKKLDKSPHINSAHEREVMPDSWLKKVNVSALQ